MKPRQKEAIPLIVNKDQETLTSIMNIKDTKYSGVPNKRGGGGGVLIISRESENQIFSRTKTKKCITGLINKRGEGGVIIRYSRVSVILHSYGFSC